MMTMIQSPKTISAWLGAGLLALAACGGPAEPSAEEIARNTVKAVIGPVVQSQFPGVPTDIVVDCVIDNATAQEIVEIANSALLGSSTDSLYAIMPIVQRPSTLQCVTQKALGLG